jgi:hypothetical protein
MAKKNKMGFIALLKTTFASSSKFTKGVIPGIENAESLPPYPPRTKEDWKAWAPAFHYELKKRAENLILKQDAFEAYGGVQCPNKNDATWRGLKHDMDHDALNLGVFWYSLKTREITPLDGNGIKYSDWKPYVEALRSAERSRLMEAESVLV